MDFRILGPIEVISEGRAVSLGGSRQRALLGLFLIRANETLSIDRLMDELFGGRAQAPSAKAMHVQISRLRKSLAAHAGGDGVIVTRGSAYELTIDPGQLDAHRFERLVAEGGQELAAGRPGPAAAALERALALWRGAPLADLAYERFTQSEIARLDELRLGAIEQHVDAELALGHHADVVGRLPGLIEENPYRERLRAQLMLALYRCDRQADALQAFQDARRALVDDLGIEPGERLRDLERAVLAQDAALTLPAAEVEPAPRPEPSPVAGPAPGRRLVTVLVAHPALRDGLDPESLHALLDRSADVCAAVVERHGGTVQRFAGDAVVGMFGVPELHEDDPLRAVRAALELRGAMAELSIGIESGEVFVGAGTRRETFATGDAIAVAAGLEDAAPPGTIHLGERAHRLVAQNVDAEPLGPVAVRGREAEVRPWRLESLRTGERLPLGSAGIPLIDRKPQLAALHNALARVGQEHACRLLTVVGPAGIGKSRLARELIDQVADDATVAVGRCLSYGDGITYRPLAEILRRLPGGDPATGVAEILAGDEQADLIGRRVLGAVGLAEEPAPAEETFWAVRRLLEAAARDRPVVAVLDDAHWAEPMLLDLVEYVATFSASSPILLLCLARPELLEKRPSWAAPQANRALLDLGAFEDSDAHAFVAAIAGDELLPPAAGHIVEIAEGNPLFLEQLTAMSAEQDAATLPPSIEAVLAARIDRLDPDERTVLARASVEGRHFHYGAVAELMDEPDRNVLAAALMGLVRKQLIRPDRPVVPGEDAFKFAHALIREVAYGGLPKRTRADLHERLAHWLRSKQPVDAILGYHLERAYRLRAELAPPGDRERALAEDAAERLAAAARGTLARGDAAAGARLLERAVALVPDDDLERPTLLSALGGALAEAGRLADADRTLADAIELSEALDGGGVAARARVEQQFVRLHAGEGTSIEQARAVADAAFDDLCRRDDHLGQCQALRLRAWVDWTESRAAAADEAWSQAAVHARTAGEERMLFDILGWRASAAVFGPMPVSTAILHCEQIREQVESSPVAVAVTLHPLALLHAMTGDFELARRLIREGNEILDELGRMESAVSHHESMVEMLAGRPAEAEARLRPGYETLERMGERALLATTAALLAQAVYAQERLDEAEELCRVSEAIAAPEDLTTQVVWRSVRAKICARRGAKGEATALGEDAVRLAEPTDLLVIHADALLDLADVLAIAGRPADAEDAARRGLELYERKGNLVSAARARAWLNAAAPA
jgi:predicted ATPase/DNA-binding SARP family transcriptional activator